MKQLWNAYIEAACRAFDMSRMGAMFFVLGLLSMLLLWMGSIIAYTWFIWVAIFAVALLVLAVVLTVEYVLRAWFVVYDLLHPQGSINTSMLEQELPTPQRLTISCADSQGRIRNEDLQGHDINAMAEAILRQAPVRSVWSRRPSWLRLPAIGRMTPRLVHAACIFRAVCSR